MKKRLALIKFLTVLTVCVVFFNFKPQSVNAYECFTVYADNEKYCIYYPEIVYGLNGVHINDLQGLCDRIYLDVLVQPTSATCKFVSSGDKTFEYDSEKYGSGVLKQTLFNEISRALLTGKNSVRVNSVKLKPEITVEDLKERTLLRASFSTSYAQSSEGRKHNVGLCADAINGSVILPNQIFSFNERTGERTEQNGYKNAKVIVDGEFIDGIGGGVCQVSTTLYNAALKAGLNVIEWHQHSLPVSYVSPSFDAMVSSQSDLKILNVTDSPIYVSALCDGETITVNVYGLSNPYEYRLKSYVTEVIYAKTKEVRADDDKYIVEKTAKNGYKSEGYLCVYKDGNLLYDYKLRSDVYNATDGVTVIR